MDHSTHATGRVLIADDDADVREVVAGALRADGYEVGTVCDGCKLLEWLDGALADPDTMPDIVITDVLMPALSGLGVLTALKRAHMPMPVIVITGSADASVRAYAKRLGAVALLKKPFDLDDLLTAVANAKALQGRSRRSSSADPVARTRSGS